VNAPWAGAPTRLLVILFDLRRLIVACAAAVKDQQHEPAADDEVKKMPRPIISQPHAGMVTSPAETHP
jgi:hypothetical protein